MHITRVVGTIHPRTGAWFFESPIRTTTHENVEVQVIVRESTFVVRITTPGDEPTDERWFRDVWVLGSTALRAALDSIGTFIGAALDLELNAATIDDTTVYVPQPRIPDLEAVRDNTIEATTLSPVVWNALENQHLRRAVADLRQAMALDEDSGFYCFRAIESLRQHYLLGADDDGAGRTQSWERLRNSLAVTRADIEVIQDAAKSRRHGGSGSADYGDNVTHVKWTRDVNLKFAASLPVQLNRHAVLDV